MSVNQKVRQRLQAALKQQSGGLLGLANLFKTYDTDGSGALSWEEFCAAIQKCGLAPSPQDIRAIFLDLDKDGNNEISYREFIVAMRGDLSNQRKVLIKRVFETIDSDGDGVISMTDIGRVFNPKNHPDVKAGRTTVNQLLRDFFDSFSTVSDTGYVTLAQFIEYYANSAAFDDDIKFTETMKGLWNLQNTSTSAPATTLSNFSNTSSSNVGGLLTDADPGLAQNVEALREQLKARGARGFVGLQRKFRIMDDDGNGSLNLVEFKKAMRECGLNFTELQLSQLFQVFDQDRSGSISFDEFLVTARGAVNARRKKLIQMAFDVLDKDGSGVIEPEDLVNTYDASKHPDVISGKRTQDDVLREFLDTFDVGGVKDGKVTRQEFENYYANVGANIDDDDYFELMIRNAWHMSGGEGWAANTANRRVLVTHSDGSQSVEEIKKDLGLRSDDKAGMMARLKAQGVDVGGGVSLYGKAGDEGSKGFAGSRVPKSLSESGKRAPSAMQNLAAIASKSAANQTGMDDLSVMIAHAGPGDGLPRPAQVSPSVPPGLALIITKLKTEIKQRGGGVFIALQRKFRIMDDDGSKTLSMGEFKKAMKEMNLGLNDAELRMLFDHFDSDRSGSIDFDEFVQGVRDPLTERRLRLVQLAFQKIDKDGNGIVDAAEVASMYDASKHPEVIAGRKTAKEVLAQFLDTFDVGGVKDGMVTQDEFINYYTNLGANIDNEDYFELMIRNAWHISGGEGWSASSANRRVLVTRADGSQIVEEIKDDLGLTSDDKAGMMSRLRAQGVVDAGNINLYGQAGDEGGKGFGSRPTSSGKPANLGRLLSSSKQGNGSSSMSSLMNPPAPPVEHIIAAKGPSILPPPAPVVSAAANSTRSSTISQINPGLGMIVNKLKAEMKQRGGGGFIALQRKFRIMDDDGSKSLSLSEFKKAMKEMNMGMADSDLRLLFDHFDTDHSGTIDFEEFIQGVRDPLTPRRLQLVVLAFSKLDKDGNGIIDATEVAACYDASKHPDVLAGRRTPADVLREFLDTFDVGGVKDGMVTQDEFINYYTNLGANIDNEDYFELMIRNAWHISGGEGWSANSANRRVLVTRADGSQSVEEIKDDLGLKADDKAGMLARLKKQGVDVGSLSLYDAAGDDSKSFTGSKKRIQTNQFRGTITPGLLPGTGVSSSPTGKAKPSKKPPLASSAAPAGVRVLIDRFKAEMKMRGANGFIGLQRKFRIMDDDNSKSLSLAEFKKALKEMNMTLSDAELRILFDYFDSDHSGSIDFEEFVQGVRDPLTDRRLALVKLAFQKIDKDGNGIVDAAEVASMYDASKHPEVIARRMTEKEVLAQFLDTFDVGGVKDGMVTQDEFINYYTNLGANIDNEDYFELMIRNAWHISGGEGWSANSANRRVLVTHSDGSQSVQEIKEDLGLKSDDRTDMMARLRSRGVDVGGGIGLYGQAGDESGKNIPSAGRPSTTASLLQVSKGNRGVGGAALNPSLNNTSLTGPPAIPDPRQQKSKKAAPSTNYGVTSLLAKLKAEMKARGANGFIGLQRKFRIIDDDNNGQLSLGEFKKAMKEMNFNLTDQELRSIFEHFDSDNSGGISFDEFVQGVRDPLTERRLRLVQLAFQKIDKDGNGIVDAAEVASMYDASKHPEVIAGRKTAKEVLAQFLDTFDVGGVKDGMVTQDEFINYYTNLGANIDNEDYFELMIRNAWHISGGEGWSANSANRRVLVTRADGSHSVEEIKDDLGLNADDKPGMIARLRAQNTFASSIALYDGGEYGKAPAVRPNTAPALGAGERMQANPKRRAEGSSNTYRSTFTIAGGENQSSDDHDDSAQPAPRVTNLSAALGGDNAPNSPSKQVYFSRGVGVAGNGGATSLASMVSSQQRGGGGSGGASAPSGRVAALMDRLRENLKARGASGIIGIQRKFRIIDDDGSKSLSIGEFSKAMAETGLGFTQEEILLLFKHFDSDGNGSIDFEEFLRHLRGPLSSRRKKLIQMAFDILDKDGSGEVTPDDLLGVYDASKHPDVIAGKRTPDQILREFLDTFDVGGEKDGVVTRQEFENYYANVSSSIDNEDYFELMIRNAWHISGGEGWSANSANRRVLVTRADGSQSVEEIKNDLGLKADDKVGMMSRLRAQGVDAGSIELYGGFKETRQPTATARGFGHRPSTAPSVASGGGNPTTGSRLFGRGAEEAKPG